MYSCLCVEIPPTDDSFVATQVTEEVSKLVPAELRVRLQNAGVPGTDTYKPDQLRTMLIDQMMGREVKLDEARLRHQDQIATVQVLPKPPT